jgi:phosphatidylserine/phosphatidylglycerophosphate/cardiolipin synthase-like enzyme
MNRSRKAVFNNWHKPQDNYFFKDDVDIYIGKSAGKQLSQAIMAAEKEVIIISPFIDEDGIDDLIKLQDRGVSTKLFFSQLLDYNRDKVLHKLIRQKQIKNYEAEQSKNKKLHRFSLISILSLVIGILSFCIFFFLILLKKEVVPFYSNIIIVGVFCFINLWVTEGKRKAAMKIPIYKYEYEGIMNFKYLRSAYNTFVHSKIYLIDGEIAYLGSVNFTRKGFIENFETRIRLNDRNEVRKLRKFVNDIYEDDGEYKGHEIEFLGRQIYSEPLY